MTLSGETTLTPHFLVLRKSAVKSMNDHNLSIFGHEIFTVVELSKICAVTMSTALVWLPYPAKKEFFYKTLCLGV